MDFRPNSEFLQNLQNKELTEIVDYLKQCLLQGRDSLSGVEVERMMELVTQAAQQGITIVKYNAILADGMLDTFINKL